MLTPDHLVQYIPILRKNGGISCSIASGTIDALVY